MWVNLFIRRRWTFRAIGGGVLRVLFRAVVHVSLSIYLFLGKVVFVFLLAFLYDTLSIVDSPSDQRFSYIGKFDLYWEI